MNQVEIANLALGRLCEERIEQVYPGEDSRLARLVSEAWDPARQHCLAGVNYPWSFALAEVELTELAVTSRQWSHVYQLPPGILQVIRLADAADTPDIPFERLGQRLHSNHSELWLRYVEDHDTPTLWPIYFNELMAWRLAMDLALPITTDHKRREYCEQHWGMTLAMATLADERGSNKAMPETNPYYEVHTA